MNQIMYLQPISYNWPVVVKIRKYKQTCCVWTWSSWGEGILWFWVGLTTVRPPPPIRPGESRCCCCCRMARVSGGVRGERPPPRLGRWPWGLTPRCPCDWANLRMLRRISRWRGGMLPCAKCCNNISRFTWPDARAAWERKWKKIKIFKFCTIENFFDSIVVFLVRK